MTATINWAIAALDCAPSEDGMTDVVKTVHWRCEGSETVGETTYSGSVYSTCSLPTPAGDEFTPYADLSKEQVLGWIWSNGVDQAATEAAVQAQIDNAKNPPIVQPPLPWANA
jgi:hypothetical protein